MLIILMYALVVACNNNDEPAPVVPTIERSVLVYIVADNTLSGYDSDDILEMLSAAEDGKFGDNRLFIYHAGRYAAPALKEVTANGLVKIKEYDTTISSVSDTRMQQVFNDFKRQSPSTHYGLVLWSHASAWTSSDQPTGDISAQSYGDDKGAHMNIDVLANVVNDEEFEFIYFDCCHMASIEVAYELRHATPYIIGSASEIPSAGMPYDATMPYLLKGDVEGAAQQTFEYYDRLAGANRTCTMSVIKTSELDNLAEATRLIFAKKPVLPENYKPFNYRTARPYYCYDLDHYVKALAGDEAAYANFQEALSKAVIYKANTPKLWNSISLEGHCGLSCMILDYITGLGNNLNWSYYYTTQWYRDVVAALYE